MNARPIFAAVLLTACSSDPLPVLIDDSSTRDVSEADVALDSDAEGDAGEDDVAIQDVSEDTEPADVAPDTEADSTSDTDTVDAAPDSDATDVVVEDAGADAPEDVVVDPDAGSPDATDVEVDLEDAADVDAGVDAADTSADATDGPTLEEILAVLRGRGETAAYEYARTEGWPIAVDGGFLVVTFDPAVTSVAGDFDDWVGSELTEDEGFAFLVVPASSDDGYKLSDGATYWADPLARSYVLDEFGELSKIAPTGVHFDRWHLVTDGVVAPRQLNVRVPAAEASHVLYAHDGQNLFDDSRASFGVSWDLAASTPDGVLVVGIDHGPDRVFEYTWIADDLRGIPGGGGGAAYADFVQDYLRPMIDAEYGEPDTVGVMGSSLGGLVSLYIAHRFPGEFDMAISLSGTLGWGSLGTHQETLLELYVAAGVRSTRLYVDSGGGVEGECVDLDEDGILDDNETGSDNYCTNRQFADEMAALGYTWEVDLWHWWEPGAPHNEAAWAARVFRPLGYFVE